MGPGFVVSTIRRCKFPYTSALLAIGVAGMLFAAGCGKDTKATKYVIRGNINPGINGVLLTLGGDDSQTDLTDALGAYQFNEIQDGHYTVTPSRANYVFEPATADVIVDGASVYDLDFAMSPAPTLNADAATE